MGRSSVDSWPNYEPRIVLRKDPRGVHTIKGVKLLVALETIQVLKSSTDGYSSLPAQVVLRPSPSFSHTFAKRAPFV